MSTRKPSLEQTIRALLLRVDDPEAGDLADALELTARAHFSTRDNADRAGKYGKCVECGQLWPCPTWLSAAGAGLEWVIAASNEVLARYGKVAPPLGDPKEALELAHRQRMETAA